MCWWWRLMDSSRWPRRGGATDLDLPLLPVVSNDSISLSNASIWELSSSTEAFSHSRASSLAFSLGSLRSRAAIKPSLENALVLVSFSTTLKLSIFSSIRLRASRRGLLSLTSFEPAHVLT